MMKKRVMYILLCMLAAAGSVKAQPVTGGLVMHLDADNIAKSSLSPDGTVATWPDSSAANNDATQQTLVNRPLYVASNADFKGHASVWFDGVNDWMTLNSSMINVGSFTMFAVAKYDRHNLEQYMITGQSPTTPNSRIRFGTNANSFVWRAGNSAEIRYTPNLDSNVFGLTSSALCYYNGELIVSGDNTSTESPSGFGIGSYNRGEKAFMQGDIAAILVYNRALSSEEIDSVNSYLVNKYLISASNPVPADDDTAYVGIPNAAGDKVTVELQWDAAKDPLDITKVDPAITKHYLYMSDGSNDPNLYLIDEIDIVDYNSITESYGPMELDLDQSYLWRVEEAVSYGSVAAAPGDPNNYVGDIWTFNTILSVPLILDQPDSVKTDNGSTVNLQVEFSSLHPVTAIWYKDSEEVVLDSRVTVSSDEDSSILTIQDVTDADQGSYYCVLNGGGETISDTAIVILKRMLARYDFEQDFVDSVGSNDGTQAGEVSFIEGVSGDFAASVSGAAGYMELTTDAYPKAGLGNGLEQFTYAFWAKPSSNLSGDGRICGAFNDGSNTGFQMGITGNGQIVIYMRQEGNASIEVRSAANGIPDDIWSHIAATYDGSSVKYYLNGSMLHQGNARELTNFAPWQYPMVCMAKNLRGQITEYYDGGLDDMTLYNYPLSEYDIAELYYNATGIEPCIESLRPSGVYDINNDCSVDILDFSELSQHWLECGLYETIVN